MEAAVIIFPGSNCDRDAATALARATGKIPHLIWHADTALPKLDLIVLPGGFSYGDYLRTGAMAAHSPIMREVISCAEKGVRVLGICNGFQVLCETQLLPGILLRNASLKFVCREVALKVENSGTDFTRLYKKGQEIRIPIAHGDGNYFAEPDTLKRLEDNDQVALRYMENPNGAAHDIAGLVSKKGNVFGLMPHPERACDPLHGSVDGALMFDSIIKVLS
ncbi:MAG: phosphoribosylformylglycinamidine synthase subunit PurQ [Alphaproteobacteria bacterium]|nr:phosphoribosylformylglycinamidine synthase subunit PurQ [Alphaproteobacteria bacterium]